MLNDPPDYWTLTFKLRWRVENNQMSLEQAWQNVKTGDLDWRQVPMEII